MNFLPIIFTSMFACQEPILHTVEFYVAGQVTDLAGRALQGETKVCARIKWQVFSKQIEGQGRVQSVTTERCSDEMVVVEADGSFNAQHSFEVNPQQLAHGLFGMSNGAYEELSLTAEDIQFYLPSFVHTYAEEFKTNDSMIEISNPAENLDGENIIISRRATFQINNQQIHQHNGNNYLEY